MILAVFALSSFFLQVLGQSCSIRSGNTSSVTTNSTSNGTAFDARIQAAADAWVYGVPAYAIALTRNFYINAGLPLNSVIPARILADAGSRSVVRPNADTLYSIAFFDLSQGPVTLHIPSITSFYFVAAMYDAFSNNFANPGTLQQSPSGNYILYGPQDAICAEANSSYAIISPTNDVWMIARFYVTNATAGSDSYTTVNSLQDELYVVDSPATILSMEPSFSNKTNAAYQSYYFLNEAVSQDAIDTAGYNANYSSAGLYAGRSFRPTISMANLTSAQSMANRTIGSAIGQAGFLRILNNGWVLPNGIGTFGTNYLKRAYIALTGLGALVQEQAIYPTYIGGALSSVNSTSYNIFFPDGEPPVIGLGFWSLTIYDTDGFFVANTISRYSIGSRDTLQKSANGSFSIIASPTQPASGISNWLPAPTEAVWLPTLRVYGAAQSVVLGNWSYPIISKLP